MGKVKAWAMDEEEKFYDIAIKVADDFEDCELFEKHMIETYGHMTYGDSETIVENLGFIFGSCYDERQVGHA